MRAKNAGGGSAKKIKTTSQSTDSVTELLNEQLIQNQLVSQINKKNKKKKLLNEIDGNQEAHATADLVAPQGQDQTEQEKEGGVLVQSDGNSSANFGSGVSVSEADEGLVMSKRFAAIIPWLGGAAAIGGIAGLASGGGGSSAPSDTTAPAAPVAAVASASDTGSSSADGITNDTTPTITGTAEAGSTVTVVMPGTGETITTTAAANGTWSVTPTTALADGTTGSAIVTAKDAAGNISAPTNVPLTIDTTLPMFSSLTTATTIAENSGAGQTIYTAVATDAHLSGSVYALSGADADKFTINSVTGAVVLVGNPNFEAKASYSFDVIATDLAGNTQTQTVALVISNVNETPIIGGVTSGTVTEASGVNNGTPGTSTVSGALTITDPDVGESVFQAHTNTSVSYGAYTIDASGNWGYTLNNANPTVQALNVGQTLNDYITVLSADGTSTTITITINGADDTAVISGTTTARSWKQVALSTAH